MNASATAQAKLTFYLLEIVLIELHILAKYQGELYILQKVSKG